MIDGKTVSIVTGCQNRTSFLIQVLPSWLSEPTVDEVVIVDWSSSPALSQDLSGYLSEPALKLVVVQNQDTWHLTRCYNLGLQVASTDLIIKLDADVRIKQKFFASHPIEPSQFYAGDALGMRAPLWGNVYAFRQDLLKVKGWNERLMGYGWDDEDLYGRLSQSGLVRKHMDYSTLAHVDHGNDLRQGDSRETLSESTERNVRMSSNDPWTEKDQMSRWSMEHHGKLVLCRPIA